MAEDESWDNDGFVPAPVIAPNPDWDEEDANDDVKDDWEMDSEDEKAEKAKEEEKPKKPAPKIQTKVKSKPGKVKVLEIIASEEPVDPIAEKMRLEKLTREKDLEVAKELFAGSAKEKEKEEEAVIDHFVPTNQQEFDTLSGLISEKIVRYKRNDCFSAFLRSLLHGITETMKSDEVKEMNHILTAIANTKIKQEREDSKGKKKKASGKTAINVNKRDMFDEVQDMGTGRDVDPDDFDFM